MNHRFSLLAVLLCVAGTALAQITITESDFSSRYVIGATYTTDSGKTTVPLNVGSASSAEQAFNFSAVTFKNKPKTFTFYDAKTSLHAAMFPGATLVLETPVIGSIMAYFYRALVPGVGIEDFGYYALGTVVYNNPPDLIQKFPLAYGTTWDYYSDTIVSVRSGDTNRSYTITHRTIDAFGTMTLGEVVSPCLRENVVESDYTTVKHAGTTTVSVAKSASLYYVQQDGSFFAMNIDTNDINASTLTPTALFNLQYHTTAVKESDGLPDGLSLVAMYPSPVRDKATLEFTLSEYAMVRIDILDLLGRTIGTVVNAPQGAGRYGVALNTTGLPAGEYCCRIAVNQHVTNQLIHVVN